MNQELDPQDRDTLDLLREALERTVRPSDSFVDLVMTGYDLTMTDTIVAELVQDSAEDREAPIRGSDFETRLLTFASAELRFEFEVRQESPEVVGHIDPPLPGSIRCEQPHGSTGQAVAPDGSFEFALMSTAPFRLAYDAPDGVSVSTQWIVP